MPTSAEAKLAVALPVFSVTVSLPITPLRLPQLVIVAVAEVFPSYACRSTRTR